MTETSEGEFIWNDRPLDTIGDLMRAMESCESRREAEEFMRQYRAVSPYADVNIGYLTGYYDPTEMQRMQEWFGVAHPIFGSVVTSAEKAIEAGKRAALGEFT